MSALFSVKNLGIALPNQRQSGRLFLFIYTGYLDESGTHGGSPVTVMGGLLARAQQWKKFEAGFAKAQKEYGFNVFHTKKFKRRDGDFKGWTSEQGVALINTLGHLMDDTITDGVAVTLHNHDYDSYYKGEETPRRLRLDTKYGLCFRMALYHFMTEVVKRKFKGDFPELHIVLEAGHKNSGDAERIFIEIKKEFDALGFNVLKAIVKADKDDCGQLMLADFVAHTTFIIQTDAMPEPMSFHHTEKPPGRHGSILHIESTPHGLKNIKTSLVDALRTKIKRIS